MEKLKRSKDIKVTNSLTPGGAVRIANSFGLLSGKEYSCPGATSICERVCYAGRLERMRPSVRNVMAHNWDLVKDADVDTITALLDVIINDFKFECEKFNADKLFRIHWDGDFFNEAYTMAWINIIKRHEDVHFWTYTRNAAAAQLLAGNNLENLALYFSADDENLQTAMTLKEKGIALAMLKDTFEEAKAVLPRAAMCPEQRKQVPLAGACVACGICVKGRADMTFSITKR
jgi:ferredoxin